MSVYHESIERLCYGTKTDYIIKILECDYYHKMSSICSQLFERYKSNTRTDSHHMCAFIRKRDNKIYFGENCIRSKKGLPVSMHAEMDAMKKVLKHSTDMKKTDKFDVLVIRISKAGKIGISRPCYHCIFAMQESQITIKNIYYSTYIGTIVRENIKNMLNNELTRVSTGWRVRTKKNKKSYSSESSSDDDSYFEYIPDQAIHILDEFGERILLTEKKLSKLANKI